VKYEGQNHECTQRKAYIFLLCITAATTILITGSSFLTQHQIADTEAHSKESTYFCRRFVYIILINEDCNWLRRLSFKDFIHNILIFGEVDNVASISFAGFEVSTRLCAVAAHT
jgi:hypothetical protein